MKHKPPAPAPAWTAAAAGWLLLAGCVVGTDYEPPVIDAPLTFGGAEGELGTRDARYHLQRWWEAFGDPVLAQLVGEAAAGNLDLAEAAARVLESRYDRAAASGELLPRLDLSADYARQRESGNLNDNLGGGFASIPLEDDLWRVGSEVSWEIDVFGRLRRAVEAADADFGASVEDYRSVFVALCGDVGLSYVSVREFEERVDVALANEQIQRRALELARVRFDTGLASNLELAEAETSLRQTLATLPTLRAQLRAEKNRLAVLTGRAPGAVDELLAGTLPPVGGQGVPDAEQSQPTPAPGAAPETASSGGPVTLVSGGAPGSAGPGSGGTGSGQAAYTPPRRVPEPPERVLVGVPAELLRRRPDLRRGERELAAAAARVGVAQADLYPRFSLVGNFGFSASDGGNLLEWDSRVFGIGPSVSWPVFQGGRLRSLVGSALARRNQALIAYERAVLLAYEEVANAMTDFARQRERHAELLRAEASAGDAVRTSETQYVDGLVDFNRVIDAQRTLFTVQDDRARSAGARTRALVRLYRALGGGWPVPDAAPGLPEPPPDRPAPDFSFLGARDAGTPIPGRERAYPQERAR